MELQFFFNLFGGIATAVLVWLLNGYRAEIKAQRDRVHEVAAKLQLLEITQARADTSMGHINKELHEIKTMLAQIFARLDRHPRDIA